MEPTPKRLRGVIADLDLPVPSSFEGGEDLIFHSPYYMGEKEGESQQPSRGWSVGSGVPTGI
jgi:hypothetical protein